MQPKKKYKQIYNPKSNRLQNYDYGSNGGYFITICTKNRQNYFGEIIDGKMILNYFGKIVFDEIVLLEKKFDYILLDEFVVMPNHLHLILIINNDCKDNDLSCLKYHVSDNNYEPDGDTINGCLYENDKKGFLYQKGGSLMKDKNIMLNKNKIGFIIRKLKGKSTFLINKSCRDTDLSCLNNLPQFSWQSNYYDRIIRNEDELQRIRKYIFENPLKWELDKNNTENLFM